MKCSIATYFTFKYKPIIDTDSVLAIKLFITIDTEEDSWDQYTAINNVVDNVEAIPGLQKLFDRYGAMPTYLVNYPVASNKRACRIFQNILNKGRCEIGTHCHPWNTPPFENDIEKCVTMMHSLPYELIEQKMEVLHNTIIKAFQITPICFRAGRYSFDHYVAKIIFQLGYMVDTSMTPFIDWTNSGGKDFTKIPTYAYSFSPDNIYKEDFEGSILEVPITIGFFQNFMKHYGILRNKILSGPFSRYHIIGVLEKLGLMNFRWLSPEVSSGNDMIRLAKSFIRNGHRFLNMSFHSTSLLPGKSPFVQDKKQHKLFLARIETFLNFAAKNNIKFAPLSEALKDRP